MGRHHASVMQPRIPGPKGSVGCLGKYLGKEVRFTFFFFREKTPPSVQNHFHLERPDGKNNNPGKMIHVIMLRIIISKAF